MVGRILSRLLLALLCAGSVSSCRLALHTLPTAIGRQDFHARDNERTAVYRSEGVLYAGMEGYYCTPPVGLTEEYDLKLGAWRCWPYSKNDESKPEASTFYIPLTQQMVHAWNKHNGQSAALRYERYVPGVLTEDDMSLKSHRLVAHGDVSAALRKSLEEEGMQTTPAHYILKPISIPLEMIDAVSTVPLTVAMTVTATACAAIFIPAYQIQQTIQYEPETELADSATEP